MKLTEPRPELIEQAKSFLKSIDASDYGTCGHATTDDLHKLLAAFAQSREVGSPSGERIIREHAPGEGETRFDDFDDADHPFRKWWEEHGQYMLSGGGFRESIWAARGWIAREQLSFGKEVTGESMHEAAPPRTAQEGLGDCAPLEPKTKRGWMGARSQFDTED